MVYLRRIEIKLAAHGIHRSAEDVMDEMRHLHYVLPLRSKDRKPTGEWRRPVRPRLKSYPRSVTGWTPVGSYSPYQRKGPPNANMRLFLSLISETPDRDRCSATDPAKSRGYENGHRPGLNCHNRLADLLIMIAGDSDIVPALKLARREGMQVHHKVLYNHEFGKLSPEFAEFGKLPPEFEFPEFRHIN